MAGRAVDGEATLRRPVQRGQSMILQNALVTEMDSFDMTMIVPQDHRAQDYPVFHMKIFLEQVVYQVLFPLSLVLVYAVRGHDAAANMRFIPTKDQTYVAMFQYVLNGALVVMITLLFFCGYSWADISTQMDVIAFFLLGEVALAVVTSIFQRLAVATKWSFLPKEQYDMVMTQRVTFEALQSDQIVNAWLSLASNTYGVMDKELHLAQKRLGIDARRVYLRIAADKLEWLEKEVCRVEDVGGIIEDDEASSPRSPSPRARSVRFATAPSLKPPSDEVSARIVGSDGRGLGSQPTPLPVYSTAGSGGADAKAAVDGPVHAPRPPALRFAVEAERAAASTSSPSHGGRRKAPRNSVNVFSDPRLHASASEESESGEGTVGPQGIPGPAGGWKRISAFTLTKMLIFKSSKSAQLASTNVGWITFVLCLLGSCLPILVRGACGLPVLGRNVPQGAIFLLSIYCGFMYPYIYATYLRVAYLDFRRRADVLQRLGELAMLSNPRQIRKAAGGRASTVAAPDPSTPSATFSTEGAFDVELSRSARRDADGTAGGGAVSREDMAINPLAAASRARNRIGVRAATSEASGRDKVSGGLSPAPTPSSSASAAPADGGKTRKKARSGAAVIPLDHVGNVVGFFITRRMLRVFGLRYFMRLQAYTSQALVLTGLIVVAVIVLTVTGAAQLLSFASIGFAAVALFYLVLLSGFILAMLLYGAKANGQNAEHCGILAARRLESKQAAAALRRAGYAEEATESDDVAQVLRGVMHMIDTEDKLEPLRILGVPASDTVLQAIGVSLLSAVASGINLLRGVLFK